MGLLLGAGAAWAVVSAATSSTNPDRPPEAKFDTGVVRVWNEKAGPPVELDHTPEAKLGDVIVVELKNLNHWLTENIEEGAWANEEPVANADPVMQALIKNHQLTPTLKVAEQLEMLATLLTYVKSMLGDQNEAAPPSTDLMQLTDDPDVPGQLRLVQWGEFKDDNGNAIDVSKLLTKPEIAAIVDRCTRVRDFIQEFAAQKSASLYSP